jgi:hypothetical protein
MLDVQSSLAPYASKRTCWVLLTALLLAIVSQPSLGLEESQVHAQVSTYEAVAEGDTISIFELVQDEVDDDGDAEDPGEEIQVGTWSRLRSLLAEKKKKKTDCRKPVNKKKPTCRKPSKPPTKRPSPPPPRPRPSPPPPAPVEEEYVYEAPEVPYEAPYEAPVAPLPSPPPPAIVYNQVVCDYTPRRKILSGPRMEANGGLRACTGLHVSDAGACCEVCRGTVGCNGWMYVSELGAYLQPISYSRSAPPFARYTKPLDCRVFGQPNPENVCYMLSDTTGSYVRQRHVFPSRQTRPPLAHSRSTPRPSSRIPSYRSSSIRAAQHSTKYLR